MKNSLHSKAVGLLLTAFFFASLSVQSQDQNGILNQNATAGYINYMYVESFKILDDPSVNYVDASCNSAFKYSIQHQDDYWVDVSTTDLSNWVSLPGGNGMQTFTAEVKYHIWADTGYSRRQPLAWTVHIDGTPCEECIVTTTLDAEYLCSGNWTQQVTVTHPFGDAWDTDGTRQISLRPEMTGESWNCNEDWWGDCYCEWSGCCFGNMYWTPELRFSAVMVNTSTTDSLGTLTTPLMPVTILRDPPGDQSYGFLGESTEQSFGTTIRSGTTVDQNAWAEVRVGVAGSVDLGVVSTDFEIYGQAGTSAGYSYAGDFNQELTMRMTSASEFRTPQNGTPDDVYLFSSTDYVYGYQKTIHREFCEVVAQEGLIFVPTGSSSYYYTESALISQHLPAAEQLVASLTPGTPEYENAVQQVSVFNQTIAMNAQIKAEAEYANQISFDPGLSFNTSLTTASTQSREITTSVHLSNGLSEEYSSGMGGSSVAIGGSINIGTTYGRGENSSLALENSVGYHLEDNDVTNDDQFTVKFMKDEVFGTNVFVLDSALSATSCPYEGGYQIHQPQLWVGDIGETEMTQDDLDIGSDAAYTFFVCNESNQDVSYELSQNSASNPESAQFSGFGGLSNNSPVVIAVPANQCIEGTIYLSQPSLDALDFENIELILSSDCEEPDGISTSVFVTAHFGAVGVDEVFGTTENWFTVQPNPSSGMFQLVPSRTGTPMRVSVTDLTGRTVKSPFMVSDGGKVDIDLSHLANGMYVLSAVRGGERQTVKLVVKD